jgi:hypothetical protein
MNFQGAEKAKEMIYYNYKLRSMLLYECLYDKEKQDNSVKLKIPKNELI